MNINEKNIIILDDDNQYIVIKKIVIESKTCYFISDINDTTNVKYLYENGEELIEIEDETVIQNIIKTIAETIDIDDMLKNIKKSIEQTYK